MINNISGNAARLIVGSDATILEALRVIEEGSERICLQTDCDNRLLRVVSDGDIRRALLGGKTLDHPVADIHDRRPVVVKEGMSIEEARGLLSKRVSVAPVIDDFGRVTGILRHQDVMPFLDIRSREIMVVGLGYVGLTLALVLAENGFSVRGYDIDRNLLEQLRHKQAPFFEKGLQNFLDTHIGHKLRLTDSLDSANADIYVITVGTPIIKATKQPNVDHIRKAVAGIGRKLKKNDLVILRSTVPLGCTRKVVLPLLEETSGLTAGEDFHLAFCPERTAEGRALEELVKLPQIVGGLDAHSTELALRLFNENTHTVIDVGSLEAAEMCKLMDNTFRDTVFAYANQMSVLCEAAGLNFSDLVDKVNLGYERNRVPYPSPGVGGPCLSKDPYILMSCFEQYGLRSPLIEAARIVNEAAPDIIHARTSRMLESVGKDIAGCKLFMMGLAFKGQPQTSDMRDSTSLWVIERFKAAGVAELWAYDPVVEARDIAALGVKPCTIESGFQGADVVLILNNHASYANLKLLELLGTMNQPGVFYDGWHIFRPSDIRAHPGVMYAGIGVG